MTSDTLYRAFEALGRPLVEYGLLAMLVTLAPALLLALGLKRRDGWTSLFGACFFIALASAILGVTLQGIAEGEVFALARWTLMATRAGNPTFFWLSAGAFVAIAMGLAVFGLLSLRRAWRMLAGRDRLPE